MGLRVVDYLIEHRVVVNHVTFDLEHGRMLTAKRYVFLIFLTIVTKWARLGKYVIRVHFTLFVFGLSVLSRSGDSSDASL